MHTTERWIGLLCSSLQVGKLTAAMSYDREAVQCMLKHTNKGLSGDGKCCLQMHKAGHLEVHCANCKCSMERPQIGRKPCIAEFSVLLNIDIGESLLLCCLKLQGALTNSSIIHVRYFTISFAELKSAT